MPKETLFLKNNFSVLCRKSMLDITIYTFIDTQRFTIPSISVDEAAKSFLRKNDIDESELSISKIRQTYYRILNELIDEQKTINKKS